MKQSPRKLSRVAMAKIRPQHMYGQGCPYHLLLAQSPVHYQHMQLICRCAEGDQTGLGLLPAGIM